MKILNKLLTMLKMVERDIQIDDIISPVAKRRTENSKKILLKKVFKKLLTISSQSDKIRKSLEAINK